MTPMAAAVVAFIAFVLACWAGAAIGLVHAARAEGDRMTLLHAAVAAVILFALTCRAGVPIRRRRRP